MCREIVWKLTFFQWMNSADQRENRHGGRSAEKREGLSRPPLCRSNMKKVNLSFDVNLMLIKASIQDSRIGIWQTRASPDVRSLHPSATKSAGEAAVWDDPLAVFSDHRDPLPLRRKPSEA
jgi:hypothetical protein